MGSLSGRVAIVTGSGRGIGREHALLLAAEGARVVVNDLGGGTDGSGEDRTPAELVVREIVEAGGEAVANGDNIADWAGAQRLVNAAIKAFGGLHVLVNNAGILRDRSLANMSEAEWDAVIAVHLKGHAAPAHFAAAYWKQQAAAGEPVKASIINTSSCAGLLGNFGQTNYSAAKAGIAAMTLTESIELARIGVRSNAIAPFARTRLTLQTPGLEEVVAPPDSPEEFDFWNPANVSPLVAYLATEDCPLTGAVFHVGGAEIGLMRGWSLDGLVRAESQRWTVEELAGAMKPFIDKAAAGVPASSGTTMEELSQGFHDRHART